MFGNANVLVLYRNIDQTLVNSYIFISCPLSTHVAPILLCKGPCNLFRSLSAIFVYNIADKEVDMVEDLKDEAY